MRKAHDLSPAEIALALRTATAADPDLFILGSDETAGADLTLEVGEDLLRVSLSSLYSTTMHVDSSYKAGGAGEQLARDLLSLAAITLARAGHANLASRTAARFLPGSFISAVMPLVGEIASAMYHADRIGDALDLADQLDRDESEDVRASGFMLLVAVLTKSAFLNESDQSRLQTSLNERIERHLAAGDQGAAAGFVISLAHQCMGQRRFAEAVGQFERALEIEPDYERRSYFWSEIGGAYFLADEPAKAAAAYEKALDRSEEEDLHLRTRWADALLHSGDYLRALEIFAEIDSEDIPLSAWAFVKLRAVAFVIEWTGIESQLREPEKAEQLAGQLAQPGFSDARRNELLEQGLAADAVSALVWFNAARDLLDDGQVEEALHAYLTAAVMQEGDVEAWVNVALLCIQTNDGDLFEASVVTGARLNSEDYLVEFARQLRVQLDDPADRQEALDLVDRVIESYGGLAGRKGGHTVRFTPTGGPTSQFTSTRRNRTALLERAPVLIRAALIEPRLAPEWAPFARLARIRRCRRRHAQAQWECRGRIP